MKKISLVDCPGSFASAALPFLLACLSLSAEPAVTGAEARAFIGGRSAKIVYLDNYARELYYIDFDDSILTPRKIADDPVCVSPMIHPNGDRIVYESQRSVYVRPLMENSPSRTTVFAGNPADISSREPRWWINQITGEEYVIFTMGDRMDYQWPPASGPTYSQKIEGMTPLGEPLVLLPFLMAGGRSKNGWWGCTSHHSTGMYQLYPDKVENAFYAATNWGMIPPIIACNPSISPSDSAHKQRRMMHLHPGYPPLHGQELANHQGIVIRDWIDPALGEQPLWYMGIPGIGCNDDSSGNLYWDYPEWSTDEDYFTVTGSKQITDWLEADLYVVRINYDGESQLLRLMKGDGLYYYPHMWIRTGERPAKIELDKRLLQFYSFAEDPADPPSQVIQVHNAGDGSLPELSLGSLPAWLFVEIQNNGTEDPRLIHTVSRAGLDTGTYQSQVKVYYSQNTDSALYNVEYIISEPIPTSLIPSSATVVVQQGDSVQLSATVMDQAGRPLLEQPEILWEALNTGMAVSSDGWLRTDSNTGNYQARAVSQSLACTVQVLITSWFVRLDAGAVPGSLSAGWESDEDYTQSGEPHSSTDSIELVNTDGVQNGAPAFVYLSYRYPADEFRFSSAPNGLYRVRMHFASPLPDPGKAGQEIEFDVYAEGQKILGQYRLSWDSLQTMTPEIKEFDVPVSDGDGLTILFQSGTAEAAIHGIEAFRLGSEPVLIISPNGGETYSAGDTLRVLWEARLDLVYDVGLQLLTGQQQIPMNRIRSINAGDPQWGDYVWIIPDSLDGEPFICDSCRAHVYDYNGPYTDQSDSVFSISGPLGTILPPEQTLSSLFSIQSAGPKGLSIRFKKPGTYQVRIMDVKGKTRFITSLPGIRPRTVFFPGLEKGVYFIQIEHSEKTWTGCFPLI
ncbi:hypothetical protein ACFL5V_03980 [Fibrobacterota bacterium]